MAYKVLILGDSGTGKSASLRNFKPEEVLVINAAGKPLPFKNHFECVTPSFEKLTKDVLNAMDKTNKKIIVIDDAQYIMSFQYMRRIKENGWDKWNDIQGDFFNIIKACDYMPEDTVVYFLSHIQRDDEGHEKIKTMGKMLDEKITIEGLFTTVLKTAVKDGQYFFCTQNSGLDTVKSPIGMFPTYAIDNDLKYVDEKIRNYYEIGDYKDDSEIEKMDQKAEKAEIEKPDSDGKRRRKRNVDTVKGPEQKPSETAEGSNTGNEAEQPKKRTRKARNVKDDEIPADAENTLKTPENTLSDDANFKSLANAAEETAATVNTPTNIVNTPTNIVNTPTEAPRKRRRRKKDTAPAEAVESIDITSDDLPF